MGVVHGGRENGTVRRIGATLAALTLVACASHPALDTSGVDPGLIPESALAQPALAVGRTVLWGGGVVALRRLGETSEVEVQAYPLRESQRPDDRAPPIGRFVVLWPAPLDPEEFGQGKRLTVRGRLAEGRPGAPAYPLVHGEQIRSWTPEWPGWRMSPIRLGFGLTIHN
jgi:starvation-inducible outer membrane lipoprotein